MQAPKDILLSEAITTVELNEVLSPESFVFVALMSVEEGPNKASFLPVPVGAGSIGVDVLHAVIPYGAE